MRNEVIENRSDVPGHEEVLTAAGNEMAGQSAWQHARCAIVLVSTREKQECAVLCTRDFFASPTGFRNTRSQLHSRGWKVRSPLLATMEVIRQLNGEQSISGAKPPVVRESAKERQFDEIMTSAYRHKSTDVHIEVRRGSAAVYTRVNQRLGRRLEMSEIEATELCRAIYQSLSEADSRSDEFNKRKRQKAVIERELDGDLVRFRYQHAPVAPNGFDSVLRLLPIGAGGANSIKTFQELGYSPGQSELIEQMFARPQGLVIVAGTTSSGKSTTLRHAIGQLIKLKPHIKVRTVEDPPEYLIPGASQTPVISQDSQEDEAGHNAEFRRTVAAVMRMDPDAVMVGEVRDEASAELTVRFTQSGHQVFTSLHGSDALDIIPRLHELGVSRSILGSPNFISGLIYQKLLPVLCSECKVPWHWDDDIDSKPGLAKRLRSVLTSDRGIFVQGAGCRHCDQTGIEDQTVCAETITPDEIMRDCFINGEDAKARKYWRSQRKTETSIDSPTGMRALDHAINKMFAGSVSPEDVEDKFGFLGIWDFDNKKLDNKIVLVEGSTGAPESKQVKGQLAAAAGQK